MTSLMKSHFEKQAFLYHIFLFMYGAISLHNCGHLLWTAQKRIQGDPRGSDPLLKIAKM